MYLEVNTTFFFINVYHINVYVYKIFTHPPGNVPSHDIILITNNML